METTAPTGEHDLAIVGLGLRALGLLTATPELLDHRLLIIDDRQVVGPGGFADLHIESNSVGTDFFGWVDPAGSFGDILHLPAVAELRAETGCFNLSRLAGALAETATALRRMAANWVFMHPWRVTAIRAVPGRVPVPGREAPAPSYELWLDRRTRLRAAAVVLASGIVERPVPGLVPDDRPLLMSGAVLRSGWPDPRRHPVELGDLVIVGGSHSAFSCVRRILDTDASFNSVKVVSRGRVRVFYDGIEGYRAAPRSPHEAPVDAGRDVCPKTGLVNRYHGLRNSSRELFRRIAAGEVPRVGLATAARATEIQQLCASADTVVHAAGYRSRYPALIGAGGAVIDATDHSGILRPDADGTLGHAHPDLANIFVMGADPYPYRDWRVDPASQYRRRGTQLLRRLAGTPLPPAWASAEGGPSTCAS